MSDANDNQEETTQVDTPSGKAAENAEATEGGEGQTLPVEVGPTPDVAATEGGATASDKPADATEPPAAPETTSEPVGESDSKDSNRAVLVAVARADFEMTELDELTHSQLSLVECDLSDAPAEDSPEIVEAGGWERWAKDAVNQHGQIILVTEDGPAGLTGPQYMLALGALLVGKPVFLFRGFPKGAEPTLSKVVSTEALENGVWGAKYARVAVG